MQIIDGKKVSAQVKQEVKNETELLKKEYSITPGLAVVIVGDDPASRVYVNNKKKAWDFILRNMLCLRKPHRKNF